MRKHPALNLLFIILGFAVHQNSSAQMQQTKWDRSSAIAAAQSVDIDIAVRKIGEISTLSDGVTTLDNLIALENRADWTLPAREAAMYRFTQSLVELPRDAVAKEVLQHLIAYESRTLVPHEDHQDAYVPLFNIRGAATGVENGWQRIEYSTEAYALIDSNPHLLVSGFIEFNKPNQRAGYLDALQQAQYADVIAVQDIALEQMHERPELASMVAVTAAITADTGAIQQLLVSSRQAGLSSSLRHFEDNISASEVTELLLFAVEQAPTGNAALAIAAWWPQLRHDPATRDLMLSLLGDPLLGTSAALALAQNPDLQTIKALQDTAGGESSAARRAQMALDLNRSELIVVKQP